MNKDKVFLILCAIVVIFFGFVGWARPTTVYQDKEPWTRSGYEMPPEGRPIVGFWIWDGEPNAICVIPIADKYYAYRASGPTELISDYAPSYWIDMPGTVR